MTPQHRPDPTHDPRMPSVLCLTCRHALLHEHFAGECTCGCPELKTDLPDVFLSQYMREMQAVAHFQRGNPIGKQAKKAYYTLFDLLEQRGQSAFSLAQATRWPERTLSEV